MSRFPDPAPDRLADVVIIGCGVVLGLGVMAILYAVVGAILTGL